jgi:hypothetical protein
MQVTTDAERIKELEALLAEKDKKTALDIRVSPKKAVSIYGLQRFPATLYAAQWQKILKNADELTNFIEEHKTDLSWK